MILNSRRILSLAATVTLLAPMLAFTQAPRKTGVVGAYTPPRIWPQRARTFDLLHQRIAIRYDLDQRSVAGEVETRLVVKAAPTDTIRLDASQLTIDAALDARNGKLAFTSDTAGVTVRLARRARVGDTVVFTLRYHGRPERGMYFVPRRRVMWTQGEAIETPSWVPTWNAPNDKTTWEILVTADTGVSVLSNGRLVEVTSADGGAQKTWHWSQELPASTYMYSIVAGKFTILHDNWRGIPVEYWVAPDTVNAGWRTFGETPSMIEIYSRVLGVNFPWSKYDQSVIPDFTYGGMENVSATTQTDLALHGAGAEPEGSGRGLDAHELAHQWFGDLTTTATWAHAWLNEGLTTYMESVENEKSRGWEAGQHSWIEQQRDARDADLNEERPLVYGDTKGRDPILLFFSGHIYPKGAQLAHQLRRLLGDSVFWAGMHRFLTDNAYRPVETADYAVAMEKASGRDLDWFFDQWAYGIGYPKVQLTRAWNAAGKKLTITLRQTQTIDATHPFFRFPATVRIVTRDSVVRREIMMTKQDQKFVLSLPSAPITFRFDEGGWLLGTVKTDQTPEELGELAKHDLDLSARWWALATLDGSTSPAARDARRLIALNERVPELRVEALRQIGMSDASASRDLVSAALGDPSNLVRAQAIRSLAYADTAAVQAQAVALITTDRSFTVQEAALSVYDPSIAPQGTALLLDRIAHGGAEEVRTAAAMRLLRKPEAAGLDAIESMSAVKESRGVRMLALRLLSEWPDKTRGIAVASRYLADGDPLFASDAARTLALIGGDAGKATLRRALAGESRVTVKAEITRDLATQR
ncbi:MAG TPA: M1 family aminopeptidase [Gemmatimonadaceae bacterium]|nr:M1 family aminopeptidase [Gemmatimonadaceae bacterium]